MRLEHNLREGPRTIATPRSTAHPESTMLRLVTRSTLAILVVGSLAACDNTPFTAPSVESFDGSMANVTRGSTARNPRTGDNGRTNTGRPDAGRDAGRPDAGRGVVDVNRVCRPDETPGLTPEQIEAIRALWEAYNEEAAPLIRYIAEIEKMAREAAANGASAERVAEILALADEAKRELAKLTARLRDAINEILSDDQRRPHCVVAVPLPTSGK
jgi:hypothetical protein